MGSIIEKDKDRINKITKYIESNFRRLKFNVVEPDGNVNTTSVISISTRSVEELIKNNMPESGDFFKLYNQVFRENEAKKMSAKREAERELTILQQTLKGFSWGDYIRFDPNEKAYEVSSKGNEYKINFDGTIIKIDFKYAP